MPRLKQTADNNIVKINLPQKAMKQTWQPRTEAGNRKSNNQTPVLKVQNPQIQRRVTRKQVQ